jgi:riboflavin transporter FmnP
LKKQQNKIRSIAFIGMLGALSAVLMFINIPLPFAPSFMKFDIAELPALFAGFFLGPVSGCGVIVVKLLLKLVLQGTDTAFVGELSNLLGSVIFVLPASVIYRLDHTKKGAIIGMTVATVLVSVVQVFMNAYLIFPMYSTLYGLPMETILSMCMAVNPLVHDYVTMMVYSVLPFNLVKHFLTSLLTYLIYKRCGTTLRNLMAAREKK